ncbi:MAG TPA: alanine racemase [Myxococcales bacterium]|nr:alanine racemase [Myxococcales bacterium]
MVSENPQVAAAIRPTRVVVDGAALAHNLAEIRRVVGPDKKVLGVVKADAYGHGAAVVGPALERAGIDWLGVALVEEGLELRARGVALPILVLDGSYGGRYDLLFQAHLTPVVFLREQLEGLAAAARRAGATAEAHLKIDTGMGRLGIAVDEVPAFGRAARELGVRLVGLCSHLANADLGDEPMARLQLARFDQALAAVRETGHAPSLLHLANSAGALEIPEARLNLVRPGLLLYGRAPAPRLAERLSLRPALRWTTEILQLKVLPADYPVSYGGRFRTARPSRIGVLPVGYADGYRRGFSHKTSVLVEGLRAPVVGLVTMDLCMIDVTDVPDARTGSEVVLLGRQGGQEISVGDLAAAGDTIDYEIFCGIGARVPRVLRP